MWWQAGKNETTDARDELSSARLSSQRFVPAVRTHWAIECSLHRVPDVTFDGDRTRNRAASAVTARRRRAV